MSARISVNQWHPLPGALPAEVASDVVYIIPTRMSADGDSQPAYTEAVRYLPKLARAQQIPVAFATPAGTRQYLSEYSIDPDVWALGLATLQMMNDWIIAAVTLFISHRAASQHYSQETARTLPLRVNVAETSTGRHYQIEGSGTDVLDALRLLQLNESTGSTSDQR